MAPTTSTNRGARAVLLLAVIVLLAGVVAALTHGDGKKKTSTLPTPTTVPQVASTTTTVKATSTTTLASTTSTTVKDAGTTTTTSEPAPTTTAQPAVPTPEQATNGLFAAYRSGDREQAARFASQDVIGVLFAVPYNPPDGSFQGCVADGDLYRCQYSQGASSYDMVAARSETDGSYAIVVITATRPEPTTAAPSP